MNYCKTMITFFYTLNTELLNYLYDPTIPHLAPKTPESRDSDIYVTKFPVSLFINVKGKKQSKLSSGRWRSEGNVGPM